MKNLSDIPQNLYIKDVFEDININSDYTTSLQLSTKNYLDLIFTIDDLKTAKDNFNYISLVNKFIPEQTSGTYDDFYKYYNNDSIIVNAYPYVKENYPTESWFPQTHTNGQVGPDGTISIIEDLPLIPQSELKKVATDSSYEQSVFGNQYYYHYNVNVYSKLDSTTGYLLVNNAITDTYESYMTSYNAFLAKLGNYHIEYFNFRADGQPYYNLTTNEPVGEYTSNIYKALRFSDKIGFYIQYKFVDTYKLMKDHKMLEYELRYDFNETQQINTLQGYIYRVTQEPRVEVIYKEDYCQVKWNEAYINRTDIKGYSIVYLTALGFDEELNEQLPMGYRSLVCPNVINLGKMLPLIPRKIKAIKLIVQQKIQYTGEAANTNLPAVDILADIKGRKAQYTESYDYQEYKCFGYLGYDFYSACSKFVPGFNVDLLNNNVGQYHSMWDTRNFTKFKPMEAQVPKSKFIEGRVILSEKNYYPYVHSLDLDSTTLSFKVNDACYKHSDILSKGAVSSVDVQVFTYDYANFSTVDDATIVESYNFTNIIDIITVDLTNAELPDHFINIKINFGLTLDTLIDNLTNLNLYINDYDNYDFDFKLAEKNNIKQLSKATTQKYNPDSTTTMHIVKNNTNYQFIHYDTTTFNINNSDTDTTCNIQISQIGSSGILQEKQKNGAEWVDNYGDITSVVDLTGGINTIDITGLFIDPEIKYLMIFITNDKLIQDSTTNYNNTILVDIEYDLNVDIIKHNPLSSIPTLESIISDKDVVHYKIQFTKKV